MAQKSTQLITPEEFTCFEGLKLLEKLLINGQLVPALKIKNILLEAESFPIHQPPPPPSFPGLKGFFESNESSKALFIAKIMNLENAHQFLEEAGAHMHSFDNDNGVRGNRLLSEAVELNCPARVDCLLTLHKDQLLFNQYDIMFAARVAVQRGNGECLRLLLNVISFEGQQYLIERKPERVIDYNNIDLLCLAASNGKTECVRMLLDFGFHVDGPTKCDETPLLLACREGQLDVVKILLETGADVNAVTGLLRDSLSAAVAAGSLDCVVELIKAGASVNHQDLLMRTPLHIAASGGLTEIATLLLERGSYLEAKDFLGWTPLHCAVRSNREGLVHYLVAVGADISAKNAGGMSPQELAISDEIRRILCG